MRPPGFRRLAALCVAILTLPDPVAGAGLGAARAKAAVVVPIHAIQGSGSTSPLDGQVVVTEGIVTARRGNGFFLQSAEGEDDGNPATSEGLFVFTGNTSLPAVAVGNRLRVSGRVLEFVPSSNRNQKPITQITSGGGASVDVSLRASGQPLPAPVAIDPADAVPGSALEALERYEGMRVRTGPLVTVAASGAFLNEANAMVTGSDGIFHAVLQGVPRPFREPGIGVNDVIAATAPAGVPRFDTNPERLRIDSDGQLGAARVTADAGIALPPLTGVLDYGNGVYTLLPDPGQLVGDATGLLPGGPAPKAVPEAPDDAISIASFNLLRFFDDVDDPAIGEPVLTPAAFRARLADTSEAICRYLKTPDVLGVVEVENLATLQRLADAVNGNLSGACGTNPRYVAHLLDGNDAGGIDVGLLASTREVRSGTPRVRVLEVGQIGKDSRFANPNGSSELLNDRPSLLAKVEVAAPNGNTVPLTVVVNHLRSLHGVNDPAPGSAGWASRGQRVRAKRVAQALEIARWIEARQQADPAERLLLLGDFNAFEFSDGLADVMGLISGREAAPGTLLEHADSPVTRPLTNLTTLAPANERYSYSFEGNAQSLDHIVVNAAVLASSLAVTTAHAAINADFSATRFGQSAVRTSDHDPVVARLTEGAFRTADLGVRVFTHQPGKGKTSPRADFHVLSANAGPAAARDVRLILAFKGPERMLGRVLAAGWTCTRTVESANLVTIDCRLPLDAPPMLLPPVLVQALPPGFGGDDTVTLEATLQSSTFDAHPGNNRGEARARIVVGRGR